jgi:hypothetical protein
MILILISFVNRKKIEADSRRPDQRSAVGRGSAVAGAAMRRAPS